jgi:hypothetical protein
LGVNQLSIFDSISKEIADAAKAIQDATQKVTAQASRPPGGPGGDAKQSNLERYGYDMVVASSQASVNQALKEMLLATPGAIFLCYKYDDAGNAVQMDPGPVGRVLGGATLFDMPDQGNQSDPRVKQLDELGFAFAFVGERFPPKIAPGTPNSAIAEMLPDIVVLDQDKARVTYQAYFGTSLVCTLDEVGKNLVWAKFVQPPDQPWIFKFNVNLDMRAADQNAFNSLPPEVQDRLRNLNPNSAFGVQQLYLDLNTVGLQDSPSIAGLDPTSRAQDLLKRVFTDTYWSSLQKSGVMLGYAVKPSNPDPVIPSIVPTDLTLQVSSYRDSQGHDTKQYPLYTLDYLVMSQNRAMPTPAPFNWNWVGPGDGRDNVVAIKRDIFADFLNSLLGKLSDLSFETSVSMTHDFESLSWSYGFRGSSDPASFTVQPAPTLPDADGFSSLLTLHWARTSSDSSQTTLHDSSVNGDFNYSLDGDISVNGAEIRMTLHAVSYFNWQQKAFGGSWANITGNFVDFQNTVEYKFGIDPSGNLTAGMSSPQFQDRSQDMDVSTWDHMVGGGAIDTMNAMRSDLSNALRNSFLNYDDQITQMLNASHSWVFPGGKMLAYRDVYFSDYQDLVAHFSYR